MSVYNSKAWSIKFATPFVKLILLFSFLLCVDVLLLLVYITVNDNFQTVFLSDKKFYDFIIFLFKIIIIGYLIAVVIGIVYPTEKKISCMVRTRLFSFEYGNPLKLKDGERLPSVKCKRLNDDKYLLSVKAVNATVEDIQSVSSFISSNLYGKFKNYAVTVIDTDIAMNEVRFTLEDVTVDRSFQYNSVEEMTPETPTLLKVQNNANIDLTTSGSMLVAGKTRSGKTTGIVSLILQVLLNGRDNHGSSVLIIDPKQAELSQLPHVVSLDEDGEARRVLQSIKEFADVIKKRQKVLNELSVKKGDAVHWWDNEADFKVNLLFIDEYVSLRSLFPKKAEKDSDYCIATFDALLKRIVTMGASTGSYVILSIAQSSVGEGGLPSMLKDAMSTKILFRPTLTEARLMWESDKLQTLAERVYNAGDAWFSSTDGVHDDVSYVRFPLMNFSVYSELGRLLSDYYD